MKIHSLSQFSQSWRLAVWIKVLAGLVPSKGCGGKEVSSSRLVVASSPCLFTSFPFYVCLCVQTSPFCRDTSPTGVELALVTSLYLCNQDKVFFLNLCLYNIPFLGILEVRTSTYEFGGDTIQPMTVIY